jgi:hypothetical protein
MQWEEADHSRGLCRDRNVLSEEQYAEIGCLSMRNGPQFSLSVTDKYGQLLNCRLRAHNHRKISAGSLHNCLLSESCARSAWSRLCGVDRTIADASCPTYALGRRWKRKSAVLDLPRESETSRHVF